MGLENHIEEINRCNQRGGRMLSVVDIMEKGTLDREMASYFLAAISKGSSFLVGAKPGGAGKTTVMCALLNFSPDMQIIPTKDSQVIKDGLKDKRKKLFLAHEIGSGSWYAYISGEDVRNFLRLTGNHMVASNLHADDLEDVLSHEGIDENNITRLDLLIFMRVKREKRRISHVYENQDGEFELVYRWDKEEDRFRKVNDSKLVTERELQEAREVVDELRASDRRTIEEVREFILERI